MLFAGKDKAKALTNGAIQPMPSLLKNAYAPKFPDKTRRLA